MRFLSLLIGAVISLSLAGCDDDELLDPSQLGRMSAALLNFEDCESLESSLKESFYHDVEFYADNYRYVWNNLRKAHRERGWAVYDFENDDAAGSAAPEAAPANHYTDTNTQVAGVDEPDIWKTDGETIYIVHHGEVGVFRAWPADELEKIESLDRDANAESELLLTPDHLIVLSAFRSEGAFVRGYGWGGAELAYPLYDYGPHLVTSFYDSTHTRMRIYARPESPGEKHQLISERIFEGRYQSARRHGETVRVLLESRLNYGYGIYERLLEIPNPWSEFKPGRRAARAYNAKLDRWVEEAKAYVDSLTLADLLPHELILPEGEDDEPSRIPLACDRIYAPEPDQRELDLLSVLTFSLDEPEEFDQIAVFGGANIVYASHDRLITSRYGWHHDPETGLSDTRSVVHSFLLGERGTRYEASGLLEGWLRNQFSLDVHEGILRAAISYTEPTETEAWWGPTANKLITMKPEGGKLVRLGETPPLAPNETIFSVRFMGDYGYIVTFRQIDPLFAIDLRDPANPAVLGELKIPGFSTYMHPLSDDHLLTIGRDVDEHSGIDQGLQLQIFDVSEKTEPRRIHQRTLPRTFSTAEHDHKAFVYDPRSGMLLIAAESYDGNTQQRSLELFTISITDGIAPYGSLNHQLLPWQAGERVLRGLLIEDFVYSMGEEYLFVHTLAQPPERIAYSSLGGARLR